jgi:hypothetical protein
VVNQLYHIPDLMGRSGLTCPHLPRGKVTMTSYFTVTQ